MQLLQEDLVLLPRNTTLQDALFSHYEASISELLRYYKSFPTKADKDFRLKGKTPQIKMSMWLIVGSSKRAIQFKDCQNFKKQGNINTVLRLIAYANIFINLYFLNVDSGSNWCYVQVYT